MLLGRGVINGSGDTFLSTFELSSSPFSSGAKIVQYGGNIYGISYFTVFSTDKYGNRRWSKKLGVGTETLTRQFRDIAVDTSGNVYVVASTTSGKAYVIKYDTSGNFVWQYKFSALYAATPYDVYLNTVCTDSSGNVYVAGITPTGGRLVAIKLNSSGTMQWGKFFQDTGYVTTNGLKIAHNGSSLYIPSTTAHSPTQGSILQLNDSTGAITNQVFRAYAIFSQLAFDSSNNLYTVGYSNLGSGNANVIVCKNPLGGGTYKKLSAASSVNAPPAIHIDSADNVFITTEDTGTTAGFLIKLDTSLTIQDRVKWDDGVGIGFNSGTSGLCSSDKYVYIGGQYNNGPYKSFVSSAPKTYAAGVDFGAISYLPDTSWVANAATPGAGTGVYANDAAFTVVEDGASGFTNDTVTYDYFITYG